MRGAEGKKMSILVGKKSNGWKHLYVLFFCFTTFRISAITPATQSFQKGTTLRWTRSLSHYHVANQQQFSDNDIAEV